jgi:hypothetical protein
MGFILTIMRANKGKKERGGWPPFFFSFLFCRISTYSNAQGRGLEKKRERERERKGRGKRRRDAIDTIFRGFFLTFEPCCETVESATENNSMA